MASTKGVIRFSVSLPPSLVKTFDASWKDMGYESRSKAAHDAFRSFISEYKWKSEKAGKIAGTITLVYYLDKPGLLKQIVEAQHTFENVVTASMHIHLAKDKCLEIIAVKGKTSDIRNLSQELMTKKGVKQLKFTPIAP
jgi:CopG family nickel-responsive transcriptional regulator